MFHLKRFAWKFHLSLLFSLFVQALDKSKYRDGLRAVRKYIPRLEQELQLLQAQTKSKPASITDAAEEETQETDVEIIDGESHSNFQSENSDEQKEVVDWCSEDDDDATTAGLDSDSEDLSDIFYTDSEMETEETERPLYLEEFEKFPVETDGKHEDFEDHLRQISVDSKKPKSSSEDVDSPNFDEVDQLFLRAASLLKKKRR